MIENHDAPLRWHQRVMAHALGMTADDYRAFRRFVHDRDAARAEALYGGLTARQWYAEALRAACQAVFAGLAKLHRIREIERSGRHTAICDALREALDEPAAQPTETE